jgi:hypothetical protein
LGFGNWISRLAALGGVDGSPPITLLLTNRLGLSGWLRSYDADQFTESSFGCLFNIAQCAKKSDNSSDLMGFEAWAWLGA